ncbi:MAG: right-handed parallel beta-helix repeat-containing protein, partial [Candidatus Heimdallarchaeota archaeon]|nr:right-handed parallel beta-helix repeat-containing protein [Candidatus Heimdallarchaeota archaeon]MCK4609608.1 right-handed parallel beta-helix repeat-containing protein [Candidatus Heimdallarchaeota archaeon]
MRNTVDSDFESHTVANNSVNGKKLGWFVGNTSETISSDIYEQIYLVSCDNVNITGLTLSNTCISIFVAYSWECNIIDCETSNNNVNGIQLYNSARINIVNCNSSYNARYGFNLRDSSETTISNSYTEHNGVAGIRCIASHDSNISSTTISFNGGNGVYIVSDEVVVTDSIIEGNGNYGIFLGTSNLCIVTDNQIIENGHGVICSDLCTSATIYGNYFIDNTHQAYDGGVNNVWFDIYNSKGNWWSDWVSSPYSIPGPAGSVDSYPLNDPAVPEYNLTLTLSLTIALSLLLVMTVSIRR